MHVLLFVAVAFIPISIIRWPARALVLLVAVMRHYMVPRPGKTFSGLVSPAADLHGLAPALRGLSVHSPAVVHEAEPRRRCPMDTIARKVMPLNIIAHIIRRAIEYHWRSLTS